jgi:superfamily II DNA/RNA helicase
MSGRDVVGQSQTGSGKTAAFAIPAIEKTDPDLKAVQVLILCPTRELAVQVAEEFHKLALFKRGITRAADLRRPILRAAVLGTEARARKSSSARRAA